MKEDIKDFPGLLEHVSRAYNSSNAISDKQTGIWQTESTSCFCDKVRRIRDELVCLGVKKGQTVGILGKPSSLWLASDLAIMTAGAVSVPFFPDEPASMFEFKLKNAGIKYLFVLNSDNWDMVRQNLSSLKKVFLAEPFGEDRKAMLIADMNSTNSSGRNHRSGIDPDSLATIIYTSGSTGMPKGVMLTHYNLISQLHASYKRFPAGPNDTTLSSLPLAHIFERMLVYYYFFSGAPVYFNRDIHELGDDLREVRPTIMTVVPRILEKVRSKLQQKIEQKPLPSRLIGRMALKWAENNLPTGNNGISQSMADSLVFKKFRESLGGRLRYIITGGSALALNDYRFFINAGLPLYQGYGMTEASPVLCVNYPGRHKIGTVGLPFPGVDVIIAPHGEIWARGPNITSGYYNMPEATAKVIDSEGWLHTGDLGSKDTDGFVSITGRIKELFKTSCGEYVSPGPIEQALSSSPIIDMALVLGENKPYVSCLLFPDTDAVCRMKNKTGFTDMPDELFLKSDRIKNIINELIDSVNAQLEHWEQIRAYRLITDPLSIEGGSLTPTMKLKRHVIEDNYSNMVDDIYSNSTLQPDSGGRLMPETNTLKGGRK